MNISQYWQLPPQEQNDLRLELRTPPGLSVDPNLKPGGYDCPCELADPVLCGRRRYGNVKTPVGVGVPVCDCSCHSDCGGE